MCSFFLLFKNKIYKIYKDLVIENDVVNNPETIDEIFGHIEIEFSQVSSTIFN